MYYISPEPPIILYISNIPLAFFGTVGINSFRNLIAFFDLADLWCLRSLIIQSRVILCGWPFSQRWGCQMVSHLVRDGEYKCSAIQSRMELSWGWPPCQRWGCWMVGHPVRDGGQNLLVKATCHLIWVYLIAGHPISDGWLECRPSWLAGLRRDIFKLAVGSKMGVIYWKVCFG